jgi:tellurite resistance protein
MFDTVSAADSEYHRETVLMAGWQGAERRKAQPGWRQLEGLPVGLFGSPMALTALSMAWQLTHAVYGTPAWIAGTFLALAVAACCVLTLGYAVKLAIAPGAVSDEFRHPIIGPLFGSVPVTLLLLPIMLAPLCVWLARALWVSGTVGIVVVAWLTASRLLAGRHRVVHATPAWIIPAVGLLAIPLAMPSLDLPPMHGVETFGFAAGMFLALLVFTLIVARLVQEPPLPDALQPSVLVLIAPFASGFTAYVSMMRQVDLFAKSLFFIVAFLLAVFLPRLRHLGRCCPFRVGWWAVGFPLAMACLPALHFATTEPRPITNVIALGLLTIATATVVGLSAQTVIGLARRDWWRLSMDPAPKCESAAP